MHLVFVLVACAAITSVQAQSSTTVYIQPSSNANSYNNFMSTSFIGLKLPSGSGTHVSITVTPGDYADNTLMTSFADRTQDGPYYYTGPSTSFNIGTPGTYWFYLSASWTTNNYDYMEMRVVASTFSGSITCTYCAPPSGWGTGWPPYGSPLLAAPPAPGAVDWPASQPAYTQPSRPIPTWVIPVIAVAIALAVFVPTSYLVFRCIQKKKAAKANNNNDTTEQPQIVIEKTTQVDTSIKPEQIELQPVTVV